MEKERVEQQGISGFLSLQDQARASSSTGAYRQTSFIVPQNVHAVLLLSEKMPGEPLNFQLPGFDQNSTGHSKQSDWYQPESRA